MWAQYLTALPEVPGEWVYHMAWVTTHSSLILLYRCLCNVHERRLLFIDLIGIGRKYGWTHTEYFSLLLPYSSTVASVLKVKVGRGRGSGKGVLLISRKRIKQIIGIFDSCLGIFGWKQRRCEKCQFLDLTDQKWYESHLLIDLKLFPLIAIAAISQIISNRQCTFKLVITQLTRTTPK